MKKIFLGIGTNMGDREANLKQALSKIEEYIGAVVSSSSVYETEPWGFMSENNFLNLVVEVETDLNPS
ncbi:MAG: 2-amino-4-hydroxy-6-hydroxymethyldihydropteridine diphosphokinase, partial [Bacteroidales bacterium]|nr:2-amino-4-hydroxy-6-hydroxymethyldihydropteridine diphosphokinase [Bacteroidales bacterium]